MNFKKTFKKIKTLFEKNNIDENCTNFCADVLGVGRVGIQFKKEISFFDYIKLISLAKKRLKGKPLNKLLKNQNFYGRDFYINENVLAPRVDTEFVVECALEYIDKSHKVLDLCSGSGAIAITIKKEKDCRVYASDVSKKALAVSKKNAKNNEAEIQFIESDMFNNISEKEFDLIISNPPYIPTEHIKTLSVEVEKYDPLIALDGGKDGLDFYRIIEKNLSEYLKPEGVLVLEIGYDQADDIKKLFAEYKVIIKKDYAGNDRVAIISFKKVNNVRKIKKD